MKNMTVESLLKRFNNYTLGILLALLAGIGVGIWGLLSVYIPTGSVILSSALYRLLLATFGLLTASQIVSGISYLSTPPDIALNEKTLLHALIEKIRGLKRTPTHFVKERRTEFIGLLTGIAAAIGLTTYLATTGGTGIFVNLVPGLGFVVTLIANISALAGLFSRIGRCIDHVRKNGAGKFSDIFRAENINYVLGITVGVILGAVMVGVCLGIFGVSSAMVPGAAPLAIGGIVFALGTIGSFASASGYIARIFDFLLGSRSLGMKKSADDKGIKSRLTPENIGTLLGVTVGLTLGIVLFATGVAGIPFFGSGLPLMAAGFIVLAACVSGFGGLGNRIGALVKRLKEKRTENKVDVDADANGETLTVENGLLPEQQVQNDQQEERPYAAPPPNPDDNKDQANNNPDYQETLPCVTLSYTPTLFKNNASDKPAPPKPVLRKQADVLASHARFAPLNSPSDSKNTPKLHLNSGCFALKS